MFKTLKSMAAAAVGALMLATPLHAQPPPDAGPGAQLEAAQALPLQQLRCGPHNKITEFLRDRYAEQQGSLGVIREHFVVEVYVSAEGSWTIIRTDRRGVACIMASGHSWHQVRLSPGDGV